MTAAQALTGLGAIPSGSARDARSSGPERSESSEPSFGDTLDRAAQSRDGRKQQVQDDAGRAQAPRETPRAEDQGRRKDAVATDNGGGEDSEGNDDAASDQETATSLALMLAALASSAAGAVDARAGSEADAAQRPDGVATVPGSTGETDMVLPGATGDETVDASALLALLNSEPAQDANETDAAADIAVQQFSVKVVGQETHLALSPAQGGAEDTLRAAEDGEVTPLAQQAVASEANAGERANRSRGRSDGGRDAPSPALSLLNRSVAAAAAQGSAEGGRSSDEQGLAGGEAGRRQDRGISNAGLGTQAAFASALQAASASPTDDTPALAEPASEQIASQVRAELKADGLGETSSDGVVKVLSIELKPANLGSVTVRLSLKDNVINLHLEAQRRETVAVIEREREALAGALASAGYDVDRITAAPQSEAGRLGAQLSRVGEAGSAGSAGSFQGQAGQSAGSSAGGGQGNGSGRSSSGQSGQAQPSGFNDERRGVARGGADGLYV